MMESDWSLIERLLNQMVEEQHKKAFLFAKKIIPNIAPEEVLQPNDFPDLESHPYFRFEEGALTGLLSVQMALSALKKDLSQKLE